MSGENGRGMRESMSGERRCSAGGAAGLCLQAALALFLVGGTAAPSSARTGEARRDRGPSLRAADLVELQQRLGAVEARDESLDLVRSRGAPAAENGEAEILAFEEHRSFVYALASGRGRRRGLEGGERASAAPRRLRRIFILKPSTLVIEDVMRARASGSSIPWRLQSSGEPRIDGRRFQVAEGTVEILGETLLPEEASLEKSSAARDDRDPVHEVVVRAPPVAGAVRFLHVFHLRSASGDDSTAGAKLSKGEDGQLELAVTASGRVFRLTFPPDASDAGEIEIDGPGDRAILPRRPLPSGILPHGPEGVRLVERWDLPYRRDRTPGWDVGRPSSHLVEAVKEGKLRPGRAIEFGCGTGTNAIYLAGEGFDVTAVDVAPTALAIAREEAEKAGVKVRWMVADVLSLPAMEPFDLIFDRGCYHHVRQYNAAGYVEAARRLSKPGTLILLLAGSDQRAGGGGPPRVKEEEIRGDFSELYDIEWLKAIRFDRPGASGRGADAWSALMRRKS
ncbi:MAG: class I SAM-dependent methyltransferase [Planctomycetes bacterium]|nr:class I SAM-dependent methyltransferase [Planctomycetota bacterium]